MTHHVQRRPLLNGVVAQRAPVPEFFAGKDEALLVRRDAFLILDFGLPVLNHARRLDLEGDCFASERVVEGLHAFTQAQNHVNLRLHLD